MCVCVCVCVCVCEREAGRQGGREGGERERVEASGFLFKQLLTDSAETFCVHGVCGHFVCILCMVILCALNVWIFCVHFSFPLLFLSLPITCIHLHVYSCSPVWRE